MATSTSTAKKTAASTEAASTSTEASSTEAASTGSAGSTEQSTTSAKGPDQGAQMQAQAVDAERASAADKSATVPTVRTAGENDDAQVVLGIDVDLEGDLYETTSGDELVTLSKDVVEEFYYPNTKRPAYRILFTKGQTVKKSVIDQANADAATLRKRLEGAEPKLEDVVDSTTLASGTGANLRSDQ